jgi:hypothetical protein
VIPEALDSVSSDCRINLSWAAWCTTHRRRGTALLYIQELLLNFHVRYCVHLLMVVWLPDWLLANRIALRNTILGVPTLGASRIDRT